MNLLDRENPYTDLLKTVDKKVTRTDNAIKEGIPDETETAINQLEARAKESKNRMENLL